MKIIEIGFTKYNNSSPDIEACSLQAKIEEGENVEDCYNKLKAIATRCLNIAPYKEIKEEIKQEIIKEISTDKNE